MSSSTRSLAVATTLLISTLALLLSACGGGGSSAAGPEQAAASTATVAVVLAADGTTASDGAQPSELEAGVLQADGTLDDPDTIKKIWLHRRPTKLRFTWTIFCFMTRCCRPAAELPAAPATLVNSATPTSQALACHWAAQA